MVIKRELILSRFRLLCVASLVCAASCGPTIKLGSNFEKSAPRRIALLPIQAPAAARKERIEIVRKNVESELRNDGYLLLDHAVIAKICKEDAQCPDRERFFTSEDADALVEVDIKSVSKNNFLAGYVDQINADLKLLGPKNSELATISHRETESGGLLFNSGQVFQGLKSSVNNYGDPGFDLLAKKFSKVIVSKLPSPSGSNQVASSAREVSIDRVESKPTKPFTYQICAYGTPHAIAAVNIDRTHSNLREISAGKYCGNYWLRRSHNIAAPAVVELRSTFGDVVRKPVTLATTFGCDLTGKFQLFSKEKSSEIALHCDTPHSKNQTVQQCFAAPQCMLDRLAVYKAPSPAGPFEKIAETQSTLWVDNSGSKEGTVYQLIGITREGLRSGLITPVTSNSAQEMNASNLKNS